MMFNESPAKTDAEPVYHFSNIPNTSPESQTSYPKFLSMYIQNPCFGLQACALRCGELEHGTRELILSFNSCTRSQQQVHHIRVTPPVVQHMYHVDSYYLTMFVHLHPLWSCVEYSKIHILVLSQFWQGNRSRWLITWHHLLQTSQEFLSAHDIHYTNLHTKYQHP